MKIAHRNFKLCLNLKSISVQIIFAIVNSCNNINTHINFNKTCINVKPERKVNYTKILQRKKSLL